MNGLKEAIRVCMSSQDDIHTANSSSPASFDFNLPKGAHTVRLFAIKGDFMPRNRRPKKNQTTRPRSAWGTVIPRFDENGGIIAWQVRYPNPLAPGKRVQRQFKPWQELEARTWLEEEKHLVDLHNKGIAEWKHPTQRKKRQAEGVQGTGAASYPVPRLCGAMGIKLQAPEWRRDSRRDTQEPQIRHPAFHHGF